MNEDVRIYLNRVILSDEVRTNDMFPKFVPLDADRHEYRFVDEPSDLDVFPNGTYIYEPSTYIPDVENKFFYRENDTTRLFYYETPENITWGSYVIRFGTPITFV